MLPKEIFKKIRKIEIKTNNLVENVFAGEYHSVFKGQGMEFCEVREYQQGDDVRIIDWKVSARMGHLFVKKYIEERELRIILLVDGSYSQRFGTVRMKNEIAAEIAAALSLTAVNNNDKVGLIIFSNRIEKYIPPKKGRKNVLRMIREILYFNSEHKQTDIKFALEYLNQVTKKRSIVFLISDFLDEDFRKPLSVASRKHDLIAIRIEDKRESDFPNVGFVELEDSETGEQILIDSRDEKFRQKFAVLHKRRKEELKTMLRSLNIDLIEIWTHQPYDKSLIDFFKQRAKRMR